VRTILAGLTILLVILAGIPVARAQGVECKTEEITYLSGGLKIRSFIFYPSRQGKYPLVAYIHGVNSRAVESRPATQVEIRPDVACTFVQKHGWVILLPERRGYGGSEGTGFQDFYAQTGLRAGSSQLGQKVVERLYTEAEDVKVGLEYALGLPYTNGSYVVWGFSAGGLIAFRIGGQPTPGLVGVIAHAPGLFWRSDCLTCYYDEVARAIEENAFKTNSPILIQYGSEDVFREPNGLLVSRLKEAGKNLTFREYPGVTHNRFDPTTWQPWLDDLVKWLRGLTSTSQ
jgi:dienelactone hydrolase